MKKLLCSLFLVFAQTALTGISLWASEAKVDDVVFTSLSDCLKHRDNGDFSYKRIVATESASRFKDQELLCSVLSEISCGISGSARPFFKIDFSNSHLTSELFRNISEFLLSNFEGLGELRFLNFSSNPALLLEENDGFSLLSGIFDKFPDTYVDLSNTKMDNIQRLRDMVKARSDIKLVWVPEDWFKWKGESAEIAELVINEDYASLVCEDEGVIKTHYAYYKNNKLGGIYWEELPFGPGFIRMKMIPTIGDISEIIRQVASDLTVKEEFLHEHFEGLKRQNLFSLYKISEEYLIQKRLKYNPLRAFLILKYGIDTHSSDPINEVFANASWLLSTFYRDGRVVAYDPQEASRLLSVAVENKSSRALEYLEDYAPELVPDDLTESYLSSIPSEFRFLSREALDRDYSVFDPSEEDTWDDVYDSKVSNTLAKHIDKAKSGSSHSAFIIGRYYVSGRKLKRDISKAYSWLRCAVDKAPEPKNQAYVEDAKKRIEKIESLARE